MSRVWAWLATAVVAAVAAVVGIVYLRGQRRADDLGRTAVDLARRHRREAARAGESEIAAVHDAAAADLARAAAEDAAAVDAAVHRGGLEYAMELLDADAERRAAESRSTPRRGPRHLALADRDASGDDE